MKDTTPTLAVLDHAAGPEADERPEDKRLKGERNRTDTLVWLSRFGWLLLGAATGCHRFAFQDFFTRPTARQKDVVALCRIVLIATFLDVFDAGLFVRYCHTANFDRELLPSGQLISFYGWI